MIATRAVGAACALLVGTATVAYADPENALGLGPEAAARAGALGAVGAGFESVHYNPAALPLGADGTTEIGLAFLRARPSLFVEALDGAMLPRELPPEIDTTTALFAGTRFDLGGAIGVDGLHAAFAVYSPLDHVFQYETHPDDRPQWLMWDDRTQHVAVWAGLGWRVTDWLSIGLSARVVFDIELFTTGRVRSITERVDPETGETVVAADTELGEELTVIGHASPIAGVVVTPVPGVRAGLVWRGKLRLDDWGWARVGGETGGLGALGYVYRFSHYYRPHEIALSAAWDVSNELSLSAELTWQLWSRAVSGELERLPGRFGDTLVPAVSGRLTVERGVDLMAGYRYVRSPFDNFGGPTNLLDNDRHEPSIGMALAPYVGNEQLPFVVTWAVRLAVLPTREERKDWQRFASDDDLMRNPGNPGYRHGGVVPSAELGVEARW